MEQGAASDPHNSPPPSCTPLAMTTETAELLVSALASTARMVHMAAEAQKSTQLACFHTGQALTQAGEVLSLAKQSYLQARRLGDGLLVALPQPDYQGLFQCMPQPPLAYEEFAATMRLAESTLLCPVLQSNMPPQGSRDPAPTATACCAHGCTLCGTQESESQGCPCVSETDENGTNEEGRSLLQIRGCDPSCHRQVEAVRLEDQMGGTFVTQRRRSPRRSFSGGVEGFSPLVSKQELSTLQPLIHCHSHQGGPGKFLSKVTRRPQETSDSDTDQSETSAKDAA